MSLAFAVLSASNPNLDLVAKRYDVDNLHCPPGTGARDKRNCSAPHLLASKHVPAAQILHVTDMWAVVQTLFGFGIDPCVWLLHRIIILWAKMRSA